MNGYHKGRQPVLSDRSHFFIQTVTNVINYSKIVINFIYLSKSLLTI